MTEDLPVNAAQLAMNAAQQAARLLTHLGYPDDEVEVVMRREFPNEPVAELLEEARTHKQFVDEEVEDADGD